MSEVQSTRKFHPIYLVLDVSETMRRTAPGELQSPFERFQNLIPSLLISLHEDHVEVRTSCWLTIVAFASTATTVLPAFPLSELPSVPAWPPMGQTNYVAVLNLLRSQIETDRATIANQASAPGKVVVARPLIFFITDGVPEVGGKAQPREQWMAARNALTNGHIDARIAAIGLEGANESVLVDLATGDEIDRNAFIADGPVPAAQLAGNIVEAILKSVGRSIEAGDMVIDTPVGMRRLGVAR